MQQDKKVFNGKNSIKQNNSIPIFLPSDNNYAPFVAVTIASICSHTGSYIHFYILDSGIDIQNENKIKSLKNVFHNFSIEFLKIDIKKAFDNFQVPPNLNLSTYSRLLIPSLKKELNKVLYIDTDVVVLKDISNLYNTDLENYTLGAVWDKSRVLYNTDTKDLMDLSDNYKYFNAGVLVIDIEKWNKTDVTSELFKIAKQYESKIKHADETLLNKYFDNNYKVIDIKYNYLDYDVVNSPNSEIIIRHFATPMKPWNSNFSMLNNKIKKLKNFEDFWHYAKMTPFYDELIENYQKEIESNPFKKRMSKIVEKGN